MDSRIQLYFSRFISSWETKTVLRADVHELPASMAERPALTNFHSA